MYNSNDYSSRIREANKAMRNKLITKLVLSAVGVVLLFTALFRFWDWQYKYIEKPMIDRYAKQSSQVNDKTLYDDYYINYKGVSK